MPAARLGVRRPHRSLHDDSRRARARLRGQRGRRRGVSRARGVEARYLADAKPDQVAQEHRSTGHKTAGCFVLTISDSKTPKDDTSGNLIRELLAPAAPT